MEFVESSNAVTPAKAMIQNYIEIAKFLLSQESQDS